MSTAGLPAPAAGLQPGRHAMEGGTGSFRGYSAACLSEGKMAIIQNDTERQTLNKRVRSRRISKSLGGCMWQPFLFAVSDMSRRSGDPL